MGLVVIARYDDLPSARLAESFLVNAGLSAHLSDHSLVSIDPLMVRALGGLRLAVPASEAEVARDLLSRAAAGEFAAAPPDEPGAARDKPNFPWMLTALVALADANTGLATTKRGFRSWADVVGWVLVAAMVVFVSLYLLAIVVWTLEPFFSPRPS